MAYDEHLADRIREQLAEQTAVTEQHMFGGLAFLLGGHMAVVASGQGGLMVRVDKAETDALVASTSAEPVEMKGRPMSGWLRVPDEAVRTTKQLSTWVARGVATASALPPKR